MAGFEDKEFVDVDNEYGKDEEQEEEEEEEEEQEERCIGEEKAAGEVAVEKEITRGHSAGSHTDQ